MIFNHGIDIHAALSRNWNAAVPGANPAQSRSEKTAIAVVPASAHQRSKRSLRIRAATAATAPVPAVTGQVVPITLTARNSTFSATTLTAPAGATVVMTFVNDDTNMPHNFALYTNATALTTIFAGDLVTGPGTITYTFTAPPAPGTYFFRCDVHPELMTGTFVVT